MYGFYSTCSHLTLGVGLPVYGMAILNSSPFLTTMSFGRKSLFIFGATVNKCTIIEYTCTNRAPYI